MVRPESNSVSRRLRAQLLRCSLDIDIIEEAINISTDPK